SLMPAYPHLLENALDTTTTRKKIEAMLTLGVPYEEAPYSEGFAARANEHLMAQSIAIVDDLKKAGIDTPADREIIAMIAYLQRVGTDIKAKPSTTATAGH
ncbi:MAG TPA: cbb3-type cytochrome c oxidase subunit II, partial [Flavobacteriales bacterium]|nr:cbb3-type cytochrome c oxidase subunit II [Flavobacteriales bacterium]